MPEWNNENCCDQDSPEFAREFATITLSQQRQDFGVTKINSAGFIRSLVVSSTAKLAEGEITT